MCNLAQLTILIDELVVIDSLKVVSLCEYFIDPFTKKKYSNGNKIIVVVNRCFLLFVIILILYNNNVFVYFDDLLIAPEDEETHNETIKSVLERT